MLSYEKILTISNQDLLVSFDLEWTKNYKIKNGNQPFCFSFIFFPLSIILTAAEKQLNFGFYIRYAESKNDIPNLIKEANKILGEFLSFKRKITIVGHQLSSDISVILNCAGEENTDNFSRLKSFWQNRKQLSSTKQKIQVFDSRYDLDILLKKKSRRLVDVCRECRLKVAQPEIIFSMTKMQNDFYKSGDKGIMEKLSILNIRHSLSAAILFLLYKERRIPKKAINVNRILYRNTADYFEYVRGKEFKRFL